MSEVTDCHCPESRPRRLAAYGLRQSRRLRRPQWLGGKSRFDHAVLAVDRTESGCLQLTFSSARGRARWCANDLLSGQDPASGTAQSPAVNEAEAAGRLVSSLAFDPAPEKSFRRWLSEGTGSRTLVVETSDADLDDLPWELLQYPSSDEFFARSERVSLCRRYRGCNDDPTGAPSGQWVGKLRVGIMPRRREDAEAPLIGKLGAVPGVEAEVVRTTDADHLARYHVLRHRGRLEKIDDIPSDIPVVVIDHDVLPDGAPRRAHATLIVPGGWPKDVESTFLVTLCQKLAAGATVEAAAAGAREAVAVRHAEAGNGWSQPRLWISEPGRKVVTPAPTTGGVASVATASPPSTATSGVTAPAPAASRRIVSGVLVFGLPLVTLLTLLNQVLLPLFTPGTRAGWMLARSPSFAHLMTVVALLLLGLWFLLVGRAVLRPLRGQATTDGLLGWAKPAEDRFLSTPVSTALTSLTLLLLLGCGYWWYEWHAHLPVENGQLAIAVTRNAAQTPYRDQLGNALDLQGTGQSIIVRSVPIDVDVLDVDRARSIGRRLNVAAVVIFRSDQPGPGDTKQQVATIVFTDPVVSRLAFSGRHGDSAPILWESSSGKRPVLPTTDPFGSLKADATQQLLDLRIKHVLATPTLRAGSLPELADATAGVIAYHLDRNALAIAQLGRGRPANVAEPDAGLVNFYLGNAYALNLDDDRARRAYDRVIAHYNSGTGMASASYQDALILAKTYLELGRLDTRGDRPAEAISHLKNAVETVRLLVTRAGDANRPAEFHGTITLIYAFYADALERSGRADEAEYWRERTREEIDTINSRSGRVDGMALSLPLFVMGDCAGAITKLSSLKHPSLEERVFRETVVFMQGMSMPGPLDIPDNLPPGAIQTGLQLANLAVARSFDAGLGYVDLDSLAYAEKLYHQILELDSTNVLAEREVAQVRSIRGLALRLDLTALQTNDRETLHKSERSWSSDPASETAMAAAANEVIDARQNVVWKLGYDDTADLMALVEAYLARQKLYLDAFQNHIASGTESALNDGGDQIVADGTAVVALTDSLLKGHPGVSQADRNQVWKLRLQALSSLQVWYEQFASDKLSAARYAEEHAEDYAIALKELNSSGSTSEIIVLPESRPSTIGQRKEHCREERARGLGGDLRRPGNDQAAIDVYEEALEEYPSHVPLLNDLALELYRQQNVDEAIERLNQALTIAPDYAIARANLGFIQLMSGSPEAGTTYDRFLASISEWPIQARLAILRAAAQDLVMVAPDATPSVVSVLDRFATTLSEITDAAATYQLAQVYGLLGKVALYRDEPAVAEEYSRRALQHDPNQLMPRLYLAISLLVRDLSATQELDDLGVKLNEPIWQATSYYSQVDAILALQRERRFYVRAFPDRQEQLTALDRVIPDVVRR